MVRRYELSSPWVARMTSQSRPSTPRECAPSQAAAASPSCVDGGDHGDHARGHNHGDHRHDRNHGHGNHNHDQRQHNHDRNHGHGGHDHNHGAGATTGRLVGALAVTATIFVAELIGAWLSDSLALAADAGHMLVDSSGLVIALCAARLVMKPRNDRFTWGWGRAEVIAAAFQAGMLIVVSLIVAWEAVARLFHEPELEPAPMLVIGIVGLVGNAVSLVILLSGKDATLNMKAAFLEVANDALGSVAVIIAAAVAMFTDWPGTDIIASVFIVVLMVPRAVRLLRTAMVILLEGTPEDLDLSEVRTHMLALPLVDDVHDLHVNTISTGVFAMTAHVAVPADLTHEQRTQVLHALEDCAAHHFPCAIEHTTFQLDTVHHSDHERLRHCTEAEN